MNNVKNKSKIVFFVMGILFAVMAVLSLIYMTDFAYIKVYYAIGKNGIEINSGTSWSQFEYTNFNLFNVINRGYSNIVIDEAKYVIYDFQVAISSVNSFILTTSLVGLGCFAALLICSNHNRRIYYKSNLIVGILAPLVALVFTVISTIRNLGVMATFNENAELFNITSVLQKPENQTDVLITKSRPIEAVKEFIEANSNITSLTFILYTVFFAIVIVYCVFCIIYSIKKYSADTKERNEIIRRAVEVNG